MDESLFLWINQGWAHPAADALFQWLSAKAGFAFPLLGLLLAAWAWQYRRDGLYVWLALVATVALGDAFGSQLKQLFAEARPCFDFTAQARLTPGAGACAGETTGMPSNHALNFFAAAAFAAVVMRQRMLSLGLFAVAVAVAVSRVYLARHYPSQVLAGALIGAGWGVLCAYVGLRHLEALRRVWGGQNQREESA